MGPKRGRGGTTAAGRGGSTAAGKQQAKQLRQVEGKKISSDEIRPGMRCEFCHQGKAKDGLEAGNLYSLRTAQGSEYYHYFCLLFSEKIPQLPTDEGILGFIPKNIHPEVKRGKSLFCMFCKKNGATVRCSVKQCVRRCHFPCGNSRKEEKMDFVFVFQDKMIPHCAHHAPRQKLVNSQRRPFSLECSICQERLPTIGPGRGRIVCPGCGGTFHRRCLQGYASTSGTYSFKCPHCSDKGFREEAERLGIYVPIQDALWENSDFYGFNSMSVTRLTCSMRACSCPQGSSYSLNGSSYELIKCDTCGQKGVHIECGKLLRECPSYICVDCTPDSEDDESEAEEEKEEVEEILLSSDQEEDSEEDEKIMHILGLPPKEDSFIRQNLSQAASAFTIISSKAASEEEMCEDDVVFIGQRDRLDPKIRTVFGAPVLQPWSVAADAANIPLIDLESLSPTQASSPSSSIGGRRWPTSAIDSVCSPITPADKSPPMMHSLPGPPLRASLPSVKPNSSRSPIVASHQPASSPTPSATHISSRSSSMTIGGGRPTNAATIHPRLFSLTASSLPAVASAASLSPTVSIRLVPADDDTVSSGSNCDSDRHSGLNTSSSIPLQRASVIRTVSGSVVMPSSAVPAAPVRTSGAPGGSGRAVSQPLNVATLHLGPAGLVYELSANIPSVDKSGTGRLSSLSSSVTITRISEDVSESEENACGLVISNVVGSASFNAEDGDSAEDSDSDIQLIEEFRPTLTGNQDGQNLLDVLRNLRN